MDGAMTHATRLRLRFLSAVSGSVLFGGVTPLGCSSGDSTAESSQDALAPSCTQGRPAVECYAPGSTHFNIGNVIDPPPPPEPHFDANGCQVQGEVRDGCCNPAESAGFIDGECCYGFCTGACCGRPLTVAGEARVAPSAVRGDWIAGDIHVMLDDLDVAERAELAREWLRDAQMEHASIASFARFVLDLLAVGAPPELVEGARRAMADEVRHARVCFALASAYAGTSFGPGPLDLRGVCVSESLAAAAALAAREGCVNETVAALSAFEQARCAADPAVRAVLERIASDETEHAELAWRFVRWALAAGGKEVAAAVNEALRPSVGVRASPGDAHVDELASARDARRARGRLRSSEQRAIEERAWTEVILPCSRALSV
jgi:hypothetical protein